ncbi:MAG TPA: ribonuclease III [Firmicutes bacterium]|nr:ribonuclease III [Bacillota bacterium]
MSDGPEARDRLDRWRRETGLVDVDPDLLQQAFVHRSYTHERGGEPDNERLEFLGDAVLGLVVCEELYRRHPDWREGELTRRKALLVSRRTMAGLAARLGLGPLLQLGRGEEETGGRQRPSVLGNALEALIGCLYLHGGYERAKRFILAVWEGELEALKGAAADPKSALQEKTQALWRQRPVYTVLREEGPDHAKRFVVRAALDGRVLGEGSGTTKKEAEQAAARQALERLALHAEPHLY